LSRIVRCQMLGQDLPGLAYQPWPGELGKRIFESISQQAWQDWLRHQTMLINENRLSPLNPDHRAYLEGEMEKFFFGGGSARPQGYVAPEA
jgi:Fe-S cluster biosynthesis and repair protein YggX